MLTKEKCKSTIIDECNGEWLIEVENDFETTIEITNINVQCGNHRLLNDIFTFVYRVGWGY